MFVAIVFELEPRLSIPDSQPEVLLLPAFNAPPAFPLTFPPSSVNLSKDCPEVEALSNPPPFRAVRFAGPTSEVELVRP